MKQDHDNLGNKSGLMSRKPQVPTFDPFEEHFVSQNTKNDFLKALESKTSAD